MAKQQTSPHYSGKGGWRGGGRPRGEVITASVTLRGRPEEIAQIKAMAHQSGLSISRFGIQTILDQKAHKQGNNDEK